MVLSQWHTPVSWLCWVYVRFWGLNKRCVFFFSWQNPPVLTPDVNLNWTWIFSLLTSLWRCGWQHEETEEELHFLRTAFGEDPVGFIVCCNSHRGMADSHRTPRTMLHPLSVLCGVNCVRPAPQRACSGEPGLAQTSHLPTSFAVHALHKRSFIRSSFLYFWIGSHIASADHKLGIQQRLALNIESCSLCFPSTEIAGRSHRSWWKCFRVLSVCRHYIGYMRLGFAKLQVILTEQFKLTYSWIKSFQ